MRMFSQNLRRLSLSRSVRWYGHERQRWQRNQSRSHRKCYFKWSPLISIPLFAPAFVVSVFRSSCDDNDTFFINGYDGGGSCMGTFIYYTLWFHFVSYLCFST